MNTCHRKTTINALKEALTGPLPKHYEKIVPSQTWHVYWMMHSLSLLEQDHFLKDLHQDVIEFIKDCLHQDGGYGGGPGQIGHLATTFAAINTLITVSTKEALDSIDRINLIKFLHQMKQGGAFTMTLDGEIDSRATYCALAVMKCLNIEDSLLLQDVAEWILSCQTYEGGFGSVPGSEAHGGYTFCCVASLCIMNQLHRADIASLVRWLANKQMSDDGGFCGRSNKLVDSCYSYWQGAVFPLLHSSLKSMILDESNTTSQNSNCRNLNNSRPTTRSSTATAEKGDQRNLEDHRELDELLDNWIYDCGALQDYILNHCQSKSGFLKDKPGAVPDVYHTCYALSGLSLSQHQPNGDIFDIGCKPINVLSKTNALFNVTPTNLEFCFHHFRNKKIERFEGEI